MVSRPLFFTTRPLEYEDLAHLQDIAQIRHIVPGQLQGSGHIPHIGNDNLNIFKIRRTDGVFISWPDTANISFSRSFPIGTGSS